MSGEDVRVGGTLPVELRGVDYGGNRGVQYRIVIGGDEIGISLGLRTREVAPVIAALHRSHITPDPDCEFCAAAAVSRGVGGEERGDG